MTYRSLLVALGQDPLCGARVQMAIRLAKEFEGHLAGVAPTGALQLPGSTESAAALAELSALAWDALRDEAEKVAQAFRNQCRRADLKSFDATIDEADHAVAIVRAAHCSDITLLTQADPAAQHHRAAQAIVEQVILHSARPTLILPYTGVDRLGDRVMVAWDDSLEANRAVADALPFLKRAKHVQIVSWDEPDVRGDRTLRTRQESMRRWLALHGVAADASIEPPTSRIAESMLSLTADLEADLIVMGAYGHARWTERLFGGATRGLLASMTVPVLMSH